MMRNEIIKTIVKPFFLKNGYMKKGNNFFREYELFKVEINVQFQKYYKETKSENFRISYNLYNNELEQKLEARYVFGGGFISNNKSWIVINLKTNLVDLKDWLKKELLMIQNNINQLQDIDYLIEVWKKYETDIQYVFLLKKNRPDDYKSWNDKIKQEILILGENLKLLYIQKEHELKRKDNLDKEMKLDGLSSIIQEKLRRKKRIENLITDINKI